MAEWDRLESRLKDLGHAASEWVDQPLEPADVRRLGVQRRHRRWAVVAVVAMIIAFGGGAGVWAAGSLPQRLEPVPAGTPTQSPTPPVEAPTATPSEVSTAGTTGHGRRIEPSRPSDTQRPPSPSYPTSSPSADETPTPTTTPTPTETEPTETSEPSPSEPEESEPGPMANPTEGGNDEPTESGPEPTEKSVTG